MIEPWRPPIAYYRQLEDHRPQMQQVPQQILPGAAKWVPDVHAIKQPQRERVYVLASGPKGVPYYDRVPKDAFTIVVNSMIKCPAFPTPDVWMAMDHRLVDPQCGEDGWWEKFTLPDCLVMFGARLVNRLYMEHVSGEIEDKHRLIKPDAYWTYIPNLAGGHFNESNPFQPGVLHGGLTVSGCAVQAAAFIFGAKEIVLCGVDMEGQGHWDGFKNPDELYKQEWPWAIKFTKMCNRLKMFYDIDVYTLSPSLIERTIERTCDGIARWDPHNEW
jgi:hypothetical protein